MGACGVYSLPEVTKSSWFTAWTPFVVSFTVTVTGYVPTLAYLCTVLRQSEPELEAVSRSVAPSPQAMVMSSSAGSPVTRVRRSIECAVGAVASRSTAR